MSTATLQTPQQQQQQPPRAASAQGHRQFLRTSNPQNNARSASHPHPSRQYEKDQVQKHGSADRSRSREDQDQVMSPEEVSKPPEEKKLGQSSPTLKLSDFELMRTLGTGNYIFLRWRLSEGMFFADSRLEQEPLREYGYVGSPTLTQKIGTKYSHSRC